MALSRETHVCSEKVGNTIQHTGTFVASIIIALIRGWKLTLVMISLLPLIGVAGAIIAKVTTAGGKILSDAYSKANVMSAQTMKNMRTVASFQAEEGMYEKYTEQLDYPRKVQKRVSTFAGMAGGAMTCCRE